VRVRSPRQSENNRQRALFRGLAGAALCASAIAAAAVLLSALGIWPGDAEKAPAQQPPALNASDDALRGHLVIDTDKAKPKKKHKAERRRSWMAAESTDDQIVVRPATPAPSTTLAPVPAQAVKAKKKKNTPAKTAPAPQEEDVTSSPGKPAPAAVATPVPAADASTGLVRLSVRSAAVAPNAAGNPELLVKLGIENARAADALPDTVTLHLRPNVPSSGSTENDQSLAFKAHVDMVDAPRPTPADPALRMRVRMTIGAAQPSTPMVQEPAPADGGKSNVIALTVPLATFRAPDDDNGPTDQPTTPPDSSGPGTPAPSDPPADPSDPPSSGPGGPSEPTPADPSPNPDQPVGHDPSPTDPAPTDPAPGDPAPQPDQPVDQDPPPTDPGPTDPQPQPQPPAGGAPAPSQPAPAQQPTEILIPVGPVRPVSGTVPVPVAPVGGDGAQADPIPVDVIVEELPPADPTPADPADEPTTAVQDPPIEVVSTPADSTDTGTTPPAASDAPASQVPADSPSISAVSDVGYSAPDPGNS
jgi:hypothetical protein